MNKANLKRYAPQARKDFIAAVTARAQLLGLSATADDRPQAEPCTVQGDVALIHGRPWPARVAGQRELLLARMQRQGVAATLEAVAYTWFNRLAALRYMELHDYLGHGRRVLSAAEGSTAGTLPEVLAHALELAEAGDLPGLRADAVRELKLANQDGELYRRVLLAQCNALHQAMPFLFEAIDDETELLLPDNLLLSDAIVAKLVVEVPEEDWAEVEAIGWLYQFYISEKKDQVIGKVVKSEDIPAATQLFTPNWIVQYLVQNSVGRLWLMANPQSPLASQWPYYIQPAEQTPEVQAQLDALIQTRIAEDGDTLNPETLTVLDPACGSGHILVVAYEVLKAIYLERGYQPRAIPRLILEKNLYGLDIDDRAAQLAAFALLMKARADDRRLFNDPPKLNVLSLQESKGLDIDELAGHLAPFGLQRAPLKALLDTFEHAKTFGSLIQIPAALNGQLAAMTAGLQKALQDGDLYAQQAAKDVLPLVWQALVLGIQFDALIANPPYMGIKYFTPQLKAFIEENHKNAKGDLYAAFMVRCALLARKSGFIGNINIPNWMFLTTFKGHREWLLGCSTIETFSENGRGIFGSDFGSCAFTFRPESIADYKGRYKRLFEKQGGVSTNEEIQGRFFTTDSFETSASDLLRIPGAQIAYWLTATASNAFQEFPRLNEMALLRKPVSRRHDPSPGRTHATATTGTVCGRPI
jgi:SAM-dependent methyltransferase